MSILNMNLAELQVGKNIMCTAQVIKQFVVVNLCTCHTTTLQLLATFPVTVYVHQPELHCLQALCECGQEPFNCTLDNTSFKSCADFCQ